MSKLRLVLAAAPAILILAATAVSRGSGTIPGERSIPTDATRQTPSCGSCHSQSTPGGNNISVLVTPAARSLDLSEAIQVTTRVQSSVGGGDGGFINESTAGAFSAGSGTRVNSTAKYVTHSNASNRSWTYGYLAPNQPGPVQLYAVALTADGSGTSGDNWAFHGADAPATTSTPVALFVNADGVKRAGSGCVGSFGNYPVIGASQSPTAGNASFAIELVGASTASPTSLLLGLPQPPLPLDPIGGQGCSLSVAPLGDISAVTSGAPGSKFGDGTAKFSIPVPASAPVGLQLAAQAVIVGVVGGRTLPITLSNSVTVTIK